MKTILCSARACGARASAFAEATADKSALALTLFSLIASPVAADEIKVMASGAFTAAYLEVVPEFERATGHKVVTSFGASMGNAPDSIPNRLRRGESVDVVILVSSALKDLIGQGRVVAGSRVDLARSGIGMAVRAGAPRPDISSVDALTRTLLQASSIAYSASASGVYVSTELFPRLGIADQVKAKSRRIDSERVGAVVARGEAEIGFQQISELLPIAGIEYVGPLPPEVQSISVVSAGVAAGATSRDAGKALIAFLASAAVLPAIRKSGLEPATVPSQSAGGRPARSEDRFEIGVQIASATSSQFDRTDPGFGGRLGWRASGLFAIEAEVMLYPRDYPDDSAFSRARWEGLFGATIGPAFDRVRPFAKVRPGFVTFREAPEPFACILIFPPPLACTLGAGRTVFALDVGGGLDVFVTRKTFLRVDAGDRLVKYPGPVFDENFVARDEGFFGHDFRFAAGGGVRF
jgi:molybdate transport system substrate-binding protein